MINLRTLQLRAGQRLDGRTFPPLWRRLLAAIAERTPKRVVGARQRRGPDGVSITTTSGGGAGYVVHPWQMSVEATDSGFGVRFTRGLINGLEAKIAGGDAGESRYVSEEQDGETPALTVGDDAFDARGIARIYARVTFEGFAWFTKSVELIAADKAPEFKAFTAYKLIGLLVRNAAGEVLPESRAFFDLKIQAVDTNENGAATFLSGPAA